MWVKGIKMVEVLVVRMRNAVKKWREQWVSHPRGERSGEITGGNGASGIFVRKGEEVTQCRLSREEAVISVLIS